MTSRTPAEAIAAVQRGGPAISAEERALAVDLLTDMLAAAAKYNVTLNDWGWVTDLPSACVDVVLRKRRDNPNTPKEN